MNLVDHSISPLERFEKALLVAGCRRDTRTTGRERRWTCPAHKDRNPSLDVRAGDDGRVLFTCRTGCSQDAVLAALQFDKHDLFPRKKGVSGAQPGGQRCNTADFPSNCGEDRGDSEREGLTLKQYAEAKRLDPDFLKTLGLQDVQYFGAQALEIPYYGVDGSTAAIRYRLCIKKGAGGDERFRWRKGDKPSLYGLEKLGEIRDVGSVTLCEGESDTQTLWSNGCPALGIPGAAIWREEWDAFLEEIPRITLAVDGDAGGEKLVARLSRSGFSDRLRLVRLNGFKDPSDLHCRNPEGFRSAWNAAMESSVPVEPIAEKPQTQSTDDETFNRLAMLTDVEYDRVRESEAEKLGVRRPTLDDEVRKRRPRSDDKGPGTAILFPELEPWTQPFNAAEWLNAVRAEINRYLALPPNAAEALALWVLHTHALDAFGISPRLGITSPEKQCGKTTTLQVLEPMVRRGLSASNITSAAVFRTQEKWQPTLLIDEADTFLKDNEELRGILNSGHTRNGRVIRTTGETHEPTVFRTWGAAAIALIGSLPETLEDRSIVIPMRRRRPGESVKRWRINYAAGLVDYARSADWWAETHMVTLRESDPELPDGLSDRARDNWRPLIAIADLAGGDWPDLARAAAISLTPGEESSRGVVLLADLRVIFHRLGWPENALTSELVAELTAPEDSRWKEIGRSQKPLTAVGLARRLREFDVKPDQWKADGKNARGYRRAAFEEAWDRYLPPDSSDPVGTLGLPNDDMALRRNPVGAEQIEVPSEDLDNMPESEGSPEVPTQDPPTEEDSDTLPWL